ncbi:MAG: asparagine synthase (glutamine-hydrolyzing) [Pseudomonadota bacterium]|nr:asparagine synthase (glutamine-hydrolyzing) [Pseudomonadota bacterium]
MCGILGWIGDYGQDDRFRFEAALDLIAYRGPDDKGVHAETRALLGHRRLSILDLSPAGHQPMIEPASGAILVFNGEIYNHIELRIELEALGHCFLGQSDTEVLLHALTEWGEKVLPRLNGMWAFAFWSPFTKKWLLARDRFGVKPLYYRKDRKGFAFASEPKALLALFPEHRSIEESTLLDFLGNNLLYARDKSFYRGIYLHPPAHFSLFTPSSGELNFERYWDYPKEISWKLTEENAVTEFSSLFTDSVRLRLRSDVPVGVTLSGGLDSTGILTAATGLSSSSLTCFTSTYKEKTQSEYRWAKHACKTANAALIPVDAPEENWLDTLRDIAWHMDAPGYSPAVYPLWLLMKRARTEKIPVLLEGQGADEALAGYPQYAVLDLLSYIKGQSGSPRQLSAIVSRLTGLKNTFTLRWALTWMLRELSPTLLEWHRRRVGFQSLLFRDIDIPKHITEIRQSSDMVQDRLQMDHAVAILPGLLHYGDIISMAHGIESRNPFLDYRLVEWMFKLPPQLRFNYGETKWVLRHYLRYNNQATIGNRQMKKGYPTPIAQWLVGKHGSEITSILTDKKSPLFELCDLKKVKRLIKKTQMGSLTAEHHLYKLLSTQLWIQKCIEAQAN